MLLEFSNVLERLTKEMFCLVQRLYARRSDARNSTFEKVLSLGDAFHRDSKAMLLRINMIRNDFTVKPSRGGPGGSNVQSDKADRKMQ